MLGGAAAALAARALPLRACAVTAVGPQRTAIESVLNDLVARRVFLSAHHGACPDDFADVAAAARTKWAPDERVVLVVGGPGALRVVEQFVTLGDEGAASSPATALAPGAAAVKTANRVAWVHSLWTGVDFLDPRSCAALLTPRGIPLSNARGVYSAMLAEHVLLSVLYFTRSVARLQANRVAKRWDRFPSVSAASLTVAIVGFGDIGRVVSERLRGGLGVKRIIGVRSGGGANVGGDEATVVNGVEIVRGDAGLDAALEVADVVVAVLPATPATKGAFDARRLALMKRGAIFINIGRGATIDEAALAASLHSDTGHLRGAALDVFATEPLPAESPLWGIGDDRLLLTPHNADISPAMFDDAARDFAALAERFAADGSAPAYLVDLAKGY